MRRNLILLVFLGLATTFLLGQAGRSTQLQFIFTSDSHYGLTRSFRGKNNVSAHVVNAAMVAQMNRLPGENFPADGGIQASRPVGPIDFVVDGGDIANRAEAAEIPIQAASKSWAEFKEDYIDGLTVHDSSGKRSPLYVVPGNHDASNAVGYYKPMVSVDKTAITEIFNLMMKPVQLKTPDTFDYVRDRMLVSHDLGGIHFVFLTLWPDSRARTWLENDLERVKGSTPVFIFAHVFPDGDPKQFRNPNGKHDINPQDQFENLLDDTFTDVVSQQKGWEDFVRDHSNITAYFHGHSNWNQFYDWTGPGHTVALHSFRVDSPMKGKFSNPDESKLSFQIATIDMGSRTMTVREVLWNADSQHPAWGASTTVALVRR
jgi:hypothetical protein